jgi:hypothetical protein
MSQPPDPPAQPPYPQPAPLPPPPPEVVRQAKQKRFGFLALGITALVAGLITLLVSLGISAPRDGGTTTAGPAPTVTKTVTEPAVVEGGSEPNEEPTPEPEPRTEEPAAFDPKPKDFKVGIKVLEKQCFGSAGCSITFRIIPSYVGSQPFPDEGRTEVTYVVTGGEDDITNTFEIDSEGTAHFDEEEFVDTSSSSRKLVAKVTEVDYSEFG